MKLLLRRLGFIFALSAIFICIVSAPAYAHAEIETSSPANGQNLKSSPDQIEIKFSESVETNANSVRLFDGSGKRVALAGRLDSNGAIVNAPVNKLSKGSYVVAWSVTSLDSHPIKGAFSFSVDSVLDPNIENSELFADILNEKVGSPFQNQAFNVTRFLVMFSLAMIIFLVFCKIFLLKENLPSLVNRFFTISVFVCAVSSLFGFVVHAALTNGIPIISVFKGTAIEEQVNSRYGLMSVARFFLCLTLFFLWKKSIRYGTLISGLLSIVLGATLTFSGHAVAGKYVFLAIPLDVVHVIAASIWVGGVLTLPIFLRSDAGSEYVKKFSKVAFYCVGALILTGVFAWWRQVGSIDAATKTWFGQLVSMKTLGVLVLIVIAFYSRQQVANYQIPSKQDSKNILLKLVYFESVILVAVLIATATLVNTIPAKTSLSLPVSRSISIDTGYLEVTVDPASVGPVVIHAYMLNENGTPYPAIDTGVSLENEVMTATWSNEKRDINSIPIQMKFQGLNHFVSVGSNVPFSGNWKLTIRVQIDSFNVVVASTDIKIKS